jgi:hypothetical protein
MATKICQKTANYIVRYSGGVPGSTVNYHIVIGYTRSQIKAYAKNLRLRYAVVHVAKCDYSI